MLSLNDPGDLAPAPFGQADALGDRQFHTGDDADEGDDQSFRRLFDLGLAYGVYRRFR
jgi:hypothetical protein